jgi:hypothetical protein
MWTVPELRRCYRDVAKARQDPARKDRAEAAVECMKRIVLEGSWRLGEGFRRCLVFDLSEGSAVLRAATAQNHQGKMEQSLGGP